MKSKLKSLAGETIIYGLSSILGRFLSFILTPVYTNYLDTNQYDFVIYSFSIVALLNVVYSFGMETAYFRFYNFDNQEQSKKAFSNAYLFINGISLIFTLILVIGSDFFGNLIASKGVQSVGYLFILAILMPFIDALTYIPYGYLRMSRQAKAFAITKFLAILVTVCLNFLFLIPFHMQAEGVFLAQIIGSFCLFLYFLPILKRNLRFNIDSTLIRQMLKFGIPTIPAAISSIILQVADRPILKELTNSDLAITTYQVNYRLGIPMMIFVTVFEYAWKPFYLSNYKDEDSKELYARILTYFTLVSSFIFLFFSFFMVYFVQVPFIGGKLINPKYWEGLNIIPIILVAYFFNGMFTNFSAGFLIEKQTKYLPLAVGLAAIINVVANFILIPMFGYEGAAWSTLIAYMFSAVVLYYYSLKVYPIKYEWGRIAIIIVAVATVFAISKVLLINSVIYGILFKVALILAYLAILVIFGFFSKEELQSIRNFIKFRKKNDKQQ
ncbi:MAG TPA: polysaccharide biosynthesis C-terminal domain-containing protein [Candidatus Kapabacteria bacterium]|nr:polysaccharide biosynthesis C-terminal domain-containing protein [Candidatus Kapabacteria bacterium]